MKTTFTLSALALALAAPAFAGTTQLERAAGTEPGAYTLSQLTEIVTAEKPNDAARIKAFHANGNNGVARADFGLTSAAPAPRVNQSQEH